VSPQGKERGVKEETREELVGWRKRKPQWYGRQEGKGEKGLATSQEGRALRAQKKGTGQLSLNKKAHHIQGMGRAEVKKGGGGNRQRNCPPMPFLRRKRKSI